MAKPLKQFSAKLKLGSRVVVAAADMQKALALLRRKLGQTVGRSGSTFDVQAIYELKRPPLVRTPQIITASANKIDAILGPRPAGQRRSAYGKSDNSDSSRGSKNREGQNTFVTKAFQRPRPIGPFGQRRRRK